MLRNLISEQGAARVLEDRAPVRGLSRLLRRNPTEAERTLWQALVKDRRFAGRGFKRQVPIGPHIADFVSFPLRCVIELASEAESEAAVQARAAKRAWLIEHDYSVLEARAADVTNDVAGVLEKLAAAIPATP